MEGDVAAAAAAAIAAADVTGNSEGLVTGLLRHNMNGSALTSLQLLTLQNDVIRVPSNDSGPSLPDYAAYDTYSSYVAFTNTSEDDILATYFEHVPKFDAPVLYFICIFLGVLILATILGNVFVVAAILTERSLQGVSNYLILSLAVADLLVAVLVMPLSVVNEVSVHWYLGEAVCDMYISMDVLCCTASILHLVAIAMDRYWAVSNIDYIRRRCAKQILLMVAVVWLVSICISIPPLFGWKDGNNPDSTGKCLISQDYGYTIFSTVGAFYCPLILMLVLNYKIYRAARARIRRKHFRVGRGRSIAGQGQNVPTITVETTCGGTRTSGSSSASDVSQDGYSAYNNGSCYISPNEASRHEISRHEFSTLDPLAERDENLGVEWGNGDGVSEGGMYSSEGDPKSSYEREREATDAEKGHQPTGRKFRLGSILDLLSPSRRASRASIATHRGQSPSPTHSPNRPHPREPWEEGASFWEPEIADGESVQVDKNEQSSEELRRQLEQGLGNSLDVSQAAASAAAAAACGGASSSSEPGSSGANVGPSGVTTTTTYDFQQPNGSAPLTESEKRWKALEEVLPYADSESDSGPSGGVEPDLDSDPQSSHGASTRSDGSSPLPGLCVSGSEPHVNHQWDSQSKVEDENNGCSPADCHWPRSMTPPVIVIVSPEEQSTPSQGSEEDNVPPPLPKTPPPQLFLESSGPRGGREIESSMSAFHSNSLGIPGGGGRGGGGLVIGGGEQGGRGGGLGGGGLGGEGAGGCDSSDGDRSKCGSSNGASSGLGIYPPHSLSHFSYGLHIPCSVSGDVAFGSVPSSLHRSGAETSDQSLRCPGSEGVHLQLSDSAIHSQFRTRTPDQLPNGEQWSSTNSSSSLPVKSRSCWEALERQFDLVYLREHGIDPRSPEPVSPGFNRHSRQRASLDSVPQRYREVRAFDFGGDFAKGGHRSSVDGAWERYGGVYVGLERADMAREWIIGDTRRDSEQSSSDAGDSTPRHHHHHLAVHSEQNLACGGDVSPRNGSIYLAHSSPKIADNPAKYGDVSLGQQILSIPSIAARFGGVYLGTPAPINAQVGTSGNRLSVQNGFQDNHVRRRHSDTQVMAAAVQGRWDWCGAETPARHRSLDGATGKKNRMEWERPDRSRECLPFRMPDDRTRSSSGLHNEDLNVTSCLDILRLARHRRRDSGEASPPVESTSRRPSISANGVPVRKNSLMRIEEDCQVNGEGGTSGNSDLYGGVYLGVPTPSLAVPSVERPLAEVSSPERLLQLPAIFLSPPDESSTWSQASASISTVSSPALALPTPSALQMSKDRLPQPPEMTVSPPTFLIQLGDDLEHSAVGGPGHVTVPQIACSCAASISPFGSRRPSTASVAGRDLLLPTTSRGERSGSFSNFLTVPSAATPNLLTVPGADRPLPRLPEDQGACAFLTVPHPEVPRPTSPEVCKVSSAGFSYYLTPPEDDTDYDDEDGLRCRIESEGYSTIEPEGCSSNFLSVPSQPMGGRVRYPGSARDSVSRVSFSPRLSTASISVSRVSFSRASEQPLLGHNRAASGSRRGKSRDKERARKEKAELRRERKAARVLGIVTSAFVVCWLPFFIMALTAPFCGDKCYFPPAMSSVFLWLGYFNSLLNPVIYTVFNPAFRSAFRKIFFRRLRKPALR